VKKQKNNSKAKYDYKYIQFSLSKREKEKIKKFADRQGYRTISDFVRRTLFDHMRRKENPELFINKKNESLNRIILERISENVIKILGNQKFLLEREDIIGQIKKRVFELHRMAEMESLSEERDRIMQLLEKHRSLSLREIQEDTELGEDIVFKILSDLNIFKITTTGRFALR
jgi:anaerobic ribonucleoside-triphosphate reductase